MFDVSRPKNPRKPAGQRGLHLHDLQALLVAGVVRQDFTTGHFAFAAGINTERSVAADAPDAAGLKVDAKAFALD